MSKKTITKFFSFVIFLTNFLLLFSGCNSVTSSQGKSDNRANKTEKNISANYEKPEIVGTIKTAEITESSGIAASKCQPDVFWTHNDSGNSANVFALNSKGEKLGTWKVRGAKNDDWEDIAAYKNEAGECFLYVGDIGNNVRKRGEFIIYLVKEPQISDADKTSGGKNPSVTAASEAIRIDYPDARPDSETLLVHPQTGDIYVLTKNLSGAASVYKLAANYDSNKTNRLEKISDFAVPAIPNGFLTGGDVSPDGRRVVFCDYFAAYEIVLPAKSKNFDDIWKEKPAVIELGERAQGEAVCYAADGEAIYATSENKNSPIIEVKRK